VLFVLHSTQILSLEAFIIYVYLFLKIYFNIRPSNANSTLNNVMAVFRCLLGQYIAIEVSVAHDLDPRFRKYTLTVVLAWK